MHSGVISLCLPLKVGINHLPNGCLAVWELPELCFHLGPGIASATFFCIQDVCYLTNVDIRPCFEANSVALYRTRLALHLRSSAGMQLFLEPRGALRNILLVDTCDTTT